MTTLNSYKCYLTEISLRLVNELIVGDYIRYSGHYMIWSPDIRASNMGTLYKVVKIDMPYICIHECTKQEEYVYIRKSSGVYIIEPTHTIHFNRNYYIKNKICKQVSEQVCE